MSSHHGFFLVEAGLVFAQAEARVDEPQEEQEAGDRTEDDAHDSAGGGPGVDARVGGGEDGWVDLGLPPEEGRQRSGERLEGACFGRW